MMEGVNSTMIYCKTFVNFTAYPQYNNNKKINLKNPKAWSTAKNEEGKKTLEA
jgi:hypothetical protein